MSMPPLSYLNFCALLLLSSHVVSAKPSGIWEVREQILGLLSEIASCFNFTHTLIFRNSYKLCSHTHHHLFKGYIHMRKKIEFLEHSKFENSSKSPKLQLRIYRFTHLSNCRDIHYGKVWSLESLDTIQQQKEVY